MENKRLQEQLSFILELDKEKNILRQTHLSNHGRREDDAEHAWHMAVMAYLLQEYSNETVDIGHVMIMCLLHDVVEIDAGDTYAYDDQGKKTQHEREEKAAERIYGILPEDQKIQLRALFEEFEENRTPEAKFAHAMDNLQPLLLNDSNGGGDWKEHHVSYNTVMQRQGRTKEGSTALFEVIKEKMDKHADAGNLIDDREKEDQ
ncbi:MAG: HD domain-containing protein [Erysipelotrichaceae bacterium]|nr:HD domain-containing protein [Erysipelotrichaceae bacterium]